MKVESFQALLAQVPALTEGQLDELVQAVETRRPKTKSLRVLEGAWGAPRCGQSTASPVPSFLTVKTAPGPRRAPICAAPAPAPGLRTRSR